LTLFKKKEKLHKRGKAFLKKNDQIIFTAQRTWKEESIPVNLKVVLKNSSNSCDDIEFLKKLNSQSESFALNIHKSIDQLSKDQFIEQIHKNVEFLRKMERIHLQQNHLDFEKENKQNQTSHPTANFEKDFEKYLSSPVAISPNPSLCEDSLSAQLNLWRIEESDRISEMNEFETFTIDPNTNSKNLKNLNQRNLESSKNSQVYYSSEDDLEDDTD